MTLMEGENTEHDYLIDLIDLITSFQFNQRICIFKQSAPETK